jgi:hypothetical protein
MTFTGAPQKGDEHMTANRFTKLFFVLAVAAGIGSAAPAGQLTPRTDINPAVLYWQAFSLYPDLPVEVRKGLMPDPRLPAADAKEQLKKFDPMVEYLRRATRMKVPCDWGIDLADGPATLMPNLVKIRQASQAVLLRAHYALEEERDREAMDELGAVLVLGRNTGAGGTLVSAMLAIGVEDTVNRFVAENFNRFSPQALQSFLKEVDAAPPRPTIKHAMSIEKTAFWEWFIVKLEALRATPSQDNAQAVRDLLTSGLGSIPEVDRIIEKAGNTPDQLIAYFREVEPIYDAIEKAADAVPAQLEREANTMRQLTEGSSNQIAQVIFPNVARARRNELGAVVHSAMLRAAITLRLEGEEAFQKLRDPFGNGPFTLRRLPADSSVPGFELDSGLSQIRTNTALKFTGDFSRSHGEGE